MPPSPPTLVPVFSGSVSWPLSCQRAEISGRLTQREMCLIIFSSNPCCLPIATPLPGLRAKRMAGNTKAAREHVQPTPGSAAARPPAASPHWCACELEQHGNSVLATQRPPCPATPRRRSPTTSQWGAPAKPLPPWEQAGSAPCRARLSAQLPGALAWRQPRGRGQVSPATVVATLTARTPTLGSALNAFPTTPHVTLTVLSVLSDFVLTSDKSLSPRMPPSPGE